MDFASITRRSFLGTSAGIVASIAGCAVPHVARAQSLSRAPGAVYGRAGINGISPGTSSAPSRGEVILLDGTALEAAHAAGGCIQAGKSVLLSSDESGGWSVLYAEF
jgi:hypothetical protein